MTCDQAVEQMSGALDGELSPEERRALEEHLAECPECRALWDELREMEDLLADAPLEVPEDFHASVMKAVADCPVPRASAPRKRPGWKTWTGLAAVAAIAVLAVGPRLLPGMGSAGGAGNSAAAPAMVSDAAASESASGSSVSGQPAETAAVPEAAAAPEEYAAAQAPAAKAGDTEAAQDRALSGQQDAPTVFSNSLPASESPAPDGGELQAEGETAAGGENGAASPESGAVSEGPQDMEQEPGLLGGVSYGAILSVAGELPEGYVWNEDGTLEVDGQALDSLLAALDEAGTSYTWEQGTPEEAAAGVALLIRTDNGQTQ